LPGGAVVDKDNARPSARKVLQVRREQNDVTGLAIPIGFGSLDASDFSVR